MTTPLITVDTITVRLRDRWLLHGSSWQINVGDQWALTGPNGAGKTTLVKAIAGDGDFAAGQGEWTVWESAERIRLDADGHAQPPVIGGKNATSRTPESGASWTMMGMPTSPTRANCSKHC